MVSGIGAAMVGGKRGNGEERPRQHADWYPTPEEVTEVLVPHLPAGVKIYEPCCGDGALAKVLERNGFEVIGTDLYDRGYGIGHGTDFDILKLEKLPCSAVVTNPPFNIAPQIIRHLLKLEPDYMALLLKASFWHAKSRVSLFTQHPPAKIIALTWRPDFMDLKRPTMEVIWCIWQKGNNGFTQYHLAPRPKKKKTKSMEIHLPNG